MEMFYHVIYIKIDCGLSQKPAKQRDERLPCQTMAKYM